MRQNGFTLVEVLISITLLSFIMIGVISVSNNSMSSKDRIVTEDKRRLQIQTAISRLEWDFTHIYSPLYFSKKFALAKNADASGGDPDADSLNKLYERNDRFSFASTDGLPVPKIIMNDKTSIEFFTSGNRSYQKGAKQSHYGWVHYSLSQMELTEDEKAQGVGAMRLVRKFVPEDPYSSKRDLFEHAKEYEVLDHLDGIEFKFWDEKNKKFVEGLTDLPDETAKHLIRAIQVTLIWKGLPGAPAQKYPLIFRPIWPPFKPEDESSHTATAEGDATAQKAPTGDAPEGEGDDLD